MDYCLLRKCIHSIRCYREQRRLQNLEIQGYLRVQIDWMAVVGKQMQRVYLLMDRQLFDRHSMKVLLEQMQPRAGITQRNTPAVQYLHPPQKRRPM